MGEVLARKGSHGQPVLDLTVSLVLNRAEWVLPANLQKLSPSPALIL